VLLETGAFAGLTGGAIGLVFRLPNFPTASFFAVSVMVVTYHIFSEWLSLIVKTRSSQAVRKLLDLQPETAQVIKRSGEITTPVSEVRVGDLVRIRPGERVPVDGKVVRGHSAVDLSLITGEPLPVDCQEGDSVFGGSVVIHGSLVVKVTVVGEETFLSRIAKHVEDARAMKPGLLHLVDRILRIYTPTVLILASLAVLFWSLGSILLGSQPDLQRAVFSGLSVLVMGYPCALGISAPLSIVRGAGEAALQGVLMRTGEAFQAFRKAGYVVMDKTGTLTEGRPFLLEIEPAGCTEEELIRIAASVEDASEHPLAQAIVREALNRKLKLLDMDSFQAVPGKGTVARIGGNRVAVGNRSFLEEMGFKMDFLSSRLDQLERLGRTVVVVGQAGSALGAIALGDRVRQDAGSLVTSLRALGVKTVLLTGDNEQNAKLIAEQLGIDLFFAGVLPEKKAAIIRSIQQRGIVAMIGDGINDAPALMQANIGIAMGSGTDIAIESADIIVMGNRLESVMAARKISRYSYGKMLQNITLAIVFNGIGIPLAATGLVYPVWAMAAMAVSVTAIFMNSLWGRSSLFFDAVLSVIRPHMD
jgi:heavy metal translocating P-type ATPase